MKTMSDQNIKQRIVVIFFIFFLISCQPKAIKTQVNDFNNFRFLEYDITQLQQGYKEGNYTIKEVVQAYLDRINQIDKHGPKLNSVIKLNPDATRIAEELDKEMKEGKIRGPLHGIPVILKDNIDTHDKMPTTAGSRALRNSYPLKDSYVVKKLREAGAVILGKANLSEWANFRGQMSTSGWSGLGGQTNNPYDITRNPSGSSSGSGVSVSANLTVLAIGTETDGSIVGPSGANGIVGIKPTVGLISRSGVIPISFTQDTPGPMARTVRDAAICLGALTGMDSIDEKTLEGRGKSLTDYTRFLKEDGLKGKRIGFYKPSLGSNYKVAKIMTEAVDLMKSKGAEIVVIDKIDSGNLDKDEINVMLYEFKDGLNKYFSSLGPDAPIKNITDLIAFNKADSIELKYFNQKWLEMAREKGDLNSAEYREALHKSLNESRGEGIDSVMDKNNLDAIIAPTGGPAAKTDLVNGDRDDIGSSSYAARAGYPNITLPMGEIDGLPVGISFFGRAWSEPVLLEIAYSFEQGTRHRKIPKFLNSCEIQF
jgi:amidase